MTIKELKDKKILILGFAREGRDTLKFLKKHFPKKVFGVADQKESLLNPPKKGVKLFLGKNYLASIKNYEVIVKSPGIPLRTAKPYLTKKHYLTSETDIFFSECQGTIVGVTGTKGKSTTTSLIYSILKKAGKKVKLVGNIGIPSLQFLLKQTPEDIFIYELSSFQLEHLEQSPHIAVFLNLYSEHLNHHGSFKKYAKAKANIAKYQNQEDFLIYNTKDTNVAKIAKTSKAQKLPWLNQGTPWLNQGTVASTEPAILIGKLFDIPNSIIKKAIQSFKPLPHRLEIIGTFKGITFVNDSLATIPEATMAALDILKDNTLTLITGGYDRGVNMKNLAQRIGKSKIQTLILFPDTGKKIFEALQRKPENIFAIKSMKEAVKVAYQYTPKGKTCLLSPAASSFNLFRDYADRGNQFKKFVKQYGK